MHVSVYTVSEVLNAISKHIVDSRYHFFVKLEKLFVADDEAEREMSGVEVGNWLREGAARLAEKESEK